MQHSLPRLLWYFIWVHFYTFYTSLKWHYLYFFCRAMDQKERLNGLITFCTRNKHNQRLNSEQIEEDFIVQRTHRRLFKQVSTKTHLVMSVTHCSDEISTTNVLPRNETLCVLYYMLCKNCAAFLLLSCVCLWSYYPCLCCLLCWCFNLLFKCQTIWSMWFNACCSRRGAHYCFCVLLVLLVSLLVQVFPCWLVCSLFVSVVWHVDSQVSL